MAGIASVIEHVLIDRMLTSDAVFPRHRKTGWGFIALLGFFVCLGAFFWLYALNTHLFPAQSARMTVMVASGLAISLAFLVTIIAFLIQEVRRTRRQRIQKELTTIFENVITLLDDEFGEPISSNPKVSLLIASVAGFIAGEKIL